MKTNFSLLFYLKKPKNYVKGAVTIYLMITVDGKPAELSTSRECEPELWIPKLDTLKVLKKRSKP